MLTRVVRVGVGGVALLVSGCAAPPPGSQNQETHRGATVIAPGSSPGLNGPYGRSLTYPVNGPANLQGLAPLGGQSIAPVGGGYMP